MPARKCLSDIVLEPGSTRVLRSALAVWILHFAFPHGVRRFPPATSVIFPAREMRCVPARRGNLGHPDLHPRLA
jgi:hypothetical protein